MTQHVRTAVFPVAGMGTRFLPATKSIPKEMLPLVDRPLIQYAIDEARAAGIEEFIFVTARGKSALEDYFDASPSLERKLREDGKDDLLAEVEVIIRSWSRDDRAFECREGFAHVVDGYTFARKDLVELLHVTWDLLQRGNCILVRVAHFDWIGDWPHGLLF